MKTFYDIIYKWVADNFGQSEADNPSWNIEALADHLSRSDINPDELNLPTKWGAFEEMKEFNLRLDIKGVADSKGITLTKPEIEAIKHRYYKLDNETWEQLAMIMDELNLKKGGYDESISNDN